MDNLKNKTVKELAMLLNELRTKRENMIMDGKTSSKEYANLIIMINNVIFELWDRIPSLANDSNVQLETNDTIKKRRR